MKSLGDSRAFRWRGRMGVVLVAPVFVGILFSSPMVEAGSVTKLILSVAGWVFFTGYVTFRIWATLFVGCRKDSELQSEGPYSVTRNPLYVGSLCLALSAACLFQSLTLVAVVVIGSIIYALRVILAEEQVLEGIFGDAFRKYKERTPRFFPSFANYHSPDEVVVKLRGMRTEAYRLWIAALLPVLVEVVAFFRNSPNWPHWFQLP